MVSSVALRAGDPFFSANGFDVGPSGISHANVGRVMIDMLTLEIMFLAVLFAVVVNIRWRRKPAAGCELPCDRARCLQSPCDGLSLMGR